VSGCAVDRNEEAAVELMAIGGDSIDLVGRVRRNSVALASATKGRAAHDHGFLDERGPLALNAQQVLSNTEDEVASPAIGHRFVYVDVELRRSKRDGRLRDRSFLIRCHKRQPTDRIGWAVAVWDTPDTGYNPAVTER